MATTAGEGTSYGGGDSGGGGGGGKFRKRPFRRPQTTPYDRPQTALRNPSTNGWLSKLVDPASKLISASAHLFFSSVFRNRLPPPPPPPPQPPEANQESRDRFQEAILENAPGVQGPVVIDGGKPTNNFDSSGLSELEQILKKKTFTRSEIDHLTELLHSRTVDLPNWDEDKRNESIIPQPVSAFGGQDGFASSPLQENRIGSHLESHRFHGCISSPVVLEEDVAAPAELAKAYMGSRPSRVSPSMLGLRGQTLREDASLQNNVPFPPNSPVMSLVPKPVVCVGVSGNGFMTPRSRRSAIYNMARTPYSRVHPTTTPKGSSSVYDDYGLPSASSSSQFTWEHARQYGPKQLKTNLSTPKCLSLPVSGSPLSNRGTGIGLDAARPPVASAQKLPSLGESNHRFLRTVRENEDTSMPGTSYTSVPSKSTEMATKILQQLEKLVPKEKSSEGKVAAGERSTSKLTPNMPSVQARRSLEYVDSSNILQNADDSHKLKDMSNTSLLDAHDAVSQKRDKVEENGLKWIIVSRHASTPAVISNATVSVKEAVPSVKTADSVSTQLFTQSSQKKWGFQMSAHEDFLELDDEIFSNEAASTPLAEGKKKFETSVVESKAVSSEAVTVDKTSAVSEFKTLDGPILKKSTDLGTSDETVVGEKNTSFTFSVSPASGTNFQPVVASPQSTSAFDKIVPPKEPNAPPPLFSFSSKNVDKIPSHTFSSTSSVSESSGLISCSPLEPKPESSSSLANVAFGTTEVVPKTQDSDKVDNNKMRKYGDTMGKSEASISSALSTSTGSMFSFGSPANSSSLTNGSLESSPSIFSSPSPAVASTQPVFGTSVPVFASVSGNGDQMSMEDSMAEDNPIQVSTPTVPVPVPVFGQQPISTPSGFVFDSNALPSAGPYPFGGQQNQSNQQNPSPFQALGSLDFSAGGSSFSLGSGGGDDKSKRKIVKVKHKRRM
ncbi:Nuclear pore complex protein NUP1 [Camellia lanceoleosa]|nr:Nuclear pore complex protein NUP1 [Camellia lanceoleosa]